jgi:hypothetical protein
MESLRGTKGEQMTDEELQKIIDDSKDKWASYLQFKDVQDAVVDAAVEAAQWFCYDSINLVFSHQSSTSGMYAKWRVNISATCTMYLGRVVNAPTGVAGTINAALADFTLQCRKAAKDREDEKKAMKMTTQSFIDVASKVAASMIEKTEGK